MLSLIIIYPEDRESTIRDRQMQTLIFLKRFSAGVRTFGILEAAGPLKDRNSWGCNISTLFCKKSLYMSWITDYCMPL